MPRKLTDRELRKIERWARADKKSELLDFLAELPRHVVISRPTLFGSWQGHDRFIVGYSNTATLIHDIGILDDTYCPIPLADTLTLQLRKNNDRTARSEGAFKRAIALGLGSKAGRVCLTAHLGDCSKQIVAAHSIQRSELAKLSRPDRHVYGFVPGGATDHRNFGLPELIGINVATTFTGVCSRHDCEIFKPIETRPFGATREELFLYHYRALLFGHYLRTFLMPKLERIQGELSMTGHETVSEHMEMNISANRIDRLEVAAVKVECDRAYAAGDHSRMLLAAWVAEIPAPIAGTVALAPHKDFCGIRLQSPKGEERLDWVTLTVSPKDGRTLVVIGANTANPSARRLIDSLNAIPPEDRMHTLTIYCLCYMDLQTLLPHFWEGMDEHRREAVIRTHQARYFPRRVPRLVNGELVAIGAGALS
jgi:hypothetical protein